MTPATPDPVISFQMLAHAAPECLPPIINLVFHTSVGSDAEVRVGLERPVMQRILYQLGTEAARIANMIIQVREKDASWQEYYIGIAGEGEGDDHLQIAAQLIAIQELRDGCLPETVEDIPQTGMLVFEQTI